MRASNPNQYTAKLEFTVLISYIFPYVSEPPIGSPLGLSLLEGFAVSTLIQSGIGFVGSDHDSVQRTIVLVTAVVSALSDGAFDALVSMAIHTHFLLCFGVTDSMSTKNKFIRCILQMVVISCYGRKTKECRPYGNDLPLHSGCGLRQFGA